jgi:hypothetical protein
MSNLVPDIDEALNIHGGIGFVDVTEFFQRSTQGVQNFTSACIIPYSVLSGGI